MKTGILIAMLATFSVAAFAQTSKTTKAKSKSATASKTTKAKTITKSTQSLGIPENAFVLTSSGKRDTSFSASGKALVIEGDNNKLDISEGTTQIFIKGKNNDINMKCADYIEVTGDGNFVSWETTKSPVGKPQIIDKGGYNNVGKRSSGALNKSDN